VSRLGRNSSGGELLERVKAGAVRVEAAGGSACGQLRSEDSGKGNGPKHQVHGGREMKVEEKVVEKRAGKDALGEGGVESEL
jgi:hypothetical protein